MKRESVYTSLPKTEKGKRQFWIMQDVLRIIMESYDNRSIYQRDEKNVCKFFIDGQESSFNMEKLEIKDGKINPQKMDSAKVIGLNGIPIEVWK